MKFDFIYSGEFFYYNFLFQYFNILEFVLKKGTEVLAFKVAHAIITNDL